MYGILIIGKKGKQHKMKIITQTDWRILKSQIQLPSATVSEVLVLKKTSKGVQ